jgi:hypothetical protein
MELNEAKMGASITQMFLISIGSPILCKKIYKNPDVDYIKKTITISPG